MYLWLEVIVGLGKVKLQETLAELLTVGHSQLEKPWGRPDLCVQAKIRQVASQGFL